ncbi:hypothetical protein Mapa_015282 [Marchantia paleacea]|nr:hypothetical protein Mapa_015282 [Marchantia paleacea]
MGNYNSKESADHIPRLRSPCHRLSYQTFHVRHSSVSFSAPPRYPLHPADLRPETKNVLVVLNFSSKDVLMKIEAKEILHAQVTVRINSRILATDRRKA